MRGNKQNDNKKNVFENFFLQIYCPVINVQWNVFLKYMVKPLPYDTPNTYKGKMLKISFTGKLQVIYLQLH